jgi:hypothetical protein
LLLVAAASSAGCKGRPANPGAPHTATNTAPSSSVRAAPALRAAPKPPPATASRTLADDERASFRAYSKALGAGRAATKAGKYGVAVKAFSAALDARPNDARAYAERGYAAYLASDFARAEGDLQRAAERAGDRNLRAQTFFNLGLVREAQQQDGSTAFAISNMLHPTEAARKKLLGKSPCAVEIQPGSGGQRQHYADWLELFTAHKDDYSGVAPNDSTSARAAICDHGGCKGQGSWLTVQGFNEAYLLHEEPTGLTVESVASASFAGYCPGGATAEIVKQTPDALVIRTEAGWGTPGISCDLDGREHECTETEQRAINEGSSDVSFVHTCNWHPYTRYSALDLTTGKWSFDVTLYDDLATGLADAERVQIGFDDSALTLTGPGGCKERLSYRR